VIDDAGPDLMVLCAELAAELGGATVSGDGGVVSYQRGDAVFARVSSDALEVRLPADIAEAAVRTPDTVVVAGETGWIRFTPQGRERHVIDRASAWFQTAWRHAAEKDLASGGAASDQAGGGTAPAI
jgi:hypothetical protein